MDWCFTAALQDLLREPTMPEAITFRKQFKMKEDYALNLFIYCTRSFMGDELLEIWQFMLIQRHKCDCPCENEHSFPEAKQWYAGVESRYF